MNEIMTSEKGVRALKVYITMVMSREQFDKQHCRLLLVVSKIAVFHGTRYATWINLYLQL